MEEGAYKSRWHRTARKSVRGKKLKWKYKSSIVDTPKILYFFAQNPYCPSCTGALRLTMLCHDM